MFRHFRRLWRRRDRRRTLRVRVQVPVLVYGHDAGKDPFHEETKTANINVDGALMPLRHTVQPGQRLVVTNIGNEATEEAVVLAVRENGLNGTDIVLKFSYPRPQFWSDLGIGGKPTLR